MHGLLELSPRRTRAPNSTRKPFPGWVDYQVNQLWIYDTTRFAKADRAATAVMDLVWRKWLATIVSAEKDLDPDRDRVHRRVTGRRAHRRGPDPRRRARAHRRRRRTPPDPAGDLRNGSADDLGVDPGVHGVARHRAALRAAAHADRQTHIETLFGHVKIEYPHLEEIDGSAVLRAELERARTHYNTMRLHEGIGYVTPDDEHTGRGLAIRQARLDGLERARQLRLDYHRQQPQERSS